MTKVDSDPAQVIVSHASFRVQLPPAQRTRLRHVRPAGPVRIPAMGGADGRRRAPVVWSGRSEPGDPGATGLLQAVRNSTAGHLDAHPGGDLGAGHDDAGGGTRVVPLLDDTQPTPMIPMPHQPGAGRTGPLLPPMRQAVGAYDAVDARPFDAYDLTDDRPGAEQDDTFARERRHANDTVRHAYYPGRRMNLGVVLLPLRVILGFLAIYSGMGKLCDPAYFDGGDRGSVVKWLTSPHPWPAAEPLRDFALSHPVAAGLSVAFLQVVIGVLTVLGLWQRVAAAFGVLLSAAVLVTVSWRTAAAYDTPDIILLAAWSPLVIAGAPVYSLDARLAGEAWRTLGPRSGIWDLRRRVLRRGTVVATVVAGLTLLVGSMLGGAVRSTEVVTVPGPDSYPTNQLPGSPLPDKSEGRKREPSRTPDVRTPEATPSSAPGTPSAEDTRGSDSTGDSTPTAGSSTGGPSQTQGTGQAPPQEPAPQEPPAGDAGPSSSGSAASGGTTGGSDGGGSTGGSDGGSSGGAGQNPIGGLLG